MLRISPTIRRDYASFSFSKTLRPFSLALLARSFSKEESS
jgi:hypothetical protein